MESHRTLWLWIGAALVAVGCALIGVAGALIVGYVVLAGALVCFVSALRGLSFPFAADPRAGEERQAAESLVDWLVHRRVLWNPMIKELPHETIEAVIKIRNRLDNGRQLLRDDEARRNLDLIRTACLALLDSPREWFQGLFSPEGEQALESFRRQARPAVEALARIYHLDPPRVARLLWRRGGPERHGLRGSPG